MDEYISDFVDKEFLSDINDSFLGKKKFELDIKSKTPQYNFHLRASQNYHFKSKSGRSSPEQDSTVFNLSHWTKYQRYKFKNQFRPYSEEFLANTISYEFDKFGTLELIHRASKTDFFSSVALRYIYTYQALYSRFDLEYDSDNSSLNFAGFGTYNFTTSFQNSWLKQVAKSTMGLLFKSSLSGLKLSSLQAFYFLEYGRYKFLLSHNSILDDPTFDNLAGNYIFGIIKQSENGVKFIMKITHDYPTKKSQIDLVRQSNLTPNTIIRNKVTSEYNIGSSLTYKINDNIKISHSAEIDLKKFFRNEEDYKYGIKVQISL